MRINRLNQLIDKNRVLRGTWQLNSQNEVTYRTSEDGTEEVHLKAALIAAEAGALVLGVTQKKTRSRFETRLHKLRGEWRVDERNRITFEVEKKRGDRDVLTFRGGWVLNEAQQIVYTLQAGRFRRKTDALQTLVFQGRWDITEKNQLTYYVGGDSSNALRFRGTLQSPSLLAKKGEIRYQIGTEIRGRSRLQTVTLFGVWKFSRRLELSFEMEYAPGVRKKIVFGGTVLLRPDTQLEVLLTAKSGEPLGAELILTKDFFDGNAQLFVRLQKTAEESALEAGVLLKW